MRLIVIFFAPWASSGIQEGSLSAPSTVQEHLVDPPGLLVGSLSALGLGVQMDFGIPDPGPTGFTGAAFAHKKREPKFPFFFRIV